MVDVKIYVMTHKKYNLLDNDLYTPLFVGAEGKEEGTVKNLTGFPYFLCVFQ